LCVALVCRFSTHTCTRLNAACLWFSLIPPACRFPDGTKERAYPDGSVRVLRVDGSTRSTYPDGSYRVKGAGQLPPSCVALCRGPRAAQMQVGGWLSSRVPPWTAACCRSIDEEMAVCNPLAAVLLQSLVKHKPIFMYVNPRKKSPRKSGEPTRGGAYAPMLLSRLVWPVLLAMCSRVFMTRLQPTACAAMSTHVSSWRKRTT